MLSKKVIECKVVVVDNKNYAIVPKDRVHQEKSGWGNIIAYREYLPDTVGLVIARDNTHYTVGLQGSTEPKLLARYAMVLDKALEAPVAYIESKGYGVKKVGFEYVVSQGSNFSLAHKNLSRLASKIVSREHKLEELAIV